MRTKKMTRKQISDAMKLAVFDKLLDAAQYAYSDAMSYIKSELEGTSLYEPSVRDLEPVRKTIVEARAAKLGKTA